MEIPQLMSHGVKDTLGECWATSLQGWPLLRHLIRFQPSCLAPSKGMVVCGLASSWIFPPLHQPPSTRVSVAPGLAALGRFGGRFGPCNQPCRGSRLVRL